jgi:hypothetical protein
MKNVIILTVFFVVTSCNFDERAQQRSSADSSTVEDVADIPEAAVPLYVAQFNGLPAPCKDPANRTCVTGRVINVGNPTSWKCICDWDGRNINTCRPQGCIAVGGQSTLSTRVTTQSVSTRVTSPATLSTRVPLNGR